MNTVNKNMHNQVKKAFKGIDLDFGNFVDNPIVVKIMMVGFGVLAFGFISSCKTYAIMNSKGFSFFSGIFVTLCLTAIIQKQLRQGNFRINLIKYGMLFWTGYMLAGEITGYLNTSSEAFEEACKAPIGVFQLFGGFISSLYLLSFFALGMTYFFSNQTGLDLINYKESSTNSLEDESDG